MDFVQDVLYWPCFLTCTVSLEYHWHHFHSFIVFIWCFQSKIMFRTKSILINTTVCAFLVQFSGQEMFVLVGQFFEHCSKVRSCYRVSTLSNPADQYFLSEVKTITKSPGLLSLKSIVHVFWLVQFHWHHFHSFYTMSWELWKHADPVPGVRPIFLKPKLHKESKNGFKTINYRPSPVMIFSKNCFRRKKIIKKIECFVDFWIFLSI